MTTLVIHPEGTFLRVAETHELAGRTVRKGLEFEVREFMPELDQPDAGEIGVAFYYGDHNGGMNNVIAEASKVELVKSATAMRSRRIPTVDQIIDALHCNGDYDGFEINEADRPHEGSREISGITTDGLPFACTITISNVYRADY